MGGFDFDTDEVLEWEIKAIHDALDRGDLRLSRHAQNESWQDGLSRDDVLDIIAFFDVAVKDLPDNPLGRTPGINFERELYGNVWGLAKVGWNGQGFYIVITVLVKR